MSLSNPALKRGVFIFAGLACVLASAVAVVPGCSSPPGPRVTLYSSMDAEILGGLVKRFEQESGVAVDIVGDTEATRTTGLVERLLSEKDAPRADVWWSGEAVGTVQLARAGVLAPSASAASTGAGRIAVTGSKGDWHGLALRPRVIVFNTKSLTGTPPRQIEDLAETRFAAKGVGIADPAFGTTRGHVAGLYAWLGEQEFARQMGAVKWRVYDGNAAVVRAVANGEIDAGLTDYDDFIGGEKNAWPLEVSFPTLRRDGSEGVFTTPGTVALVRGAPHPQEAQRLIDFILSARVQEELATNQWRGISIDAPRAAPTDVRLRRLALLTVDWEMLAGQLRPSAEAWKIALESGK